MFVVLVIVTVLLAVVAFGSAAMKLTRNDQVVASVHGTVGVPMSALPILAVLEILGAIGILVGLNVEALGIAAAVGLTLYFVGAVIGHIRVGDTKGLAAPALPLVLSLAVLVLRLSTT